MPLELLIMKTFQRGMRTFEHAFHFTLKIINKNIFKKVVKKKIKIDKKQNAAAKSHAGGLYTFLIPFYLIIPSVHNSF